MSGLHAINKGNGVQIEERQTLFFESKRLLERKGDVATISLQIDDSKRVMKEKKGRFK